MTSSIDQGMLERLKEADRRPLMSTTLLLENDNPAWTLLTRFGLLIRDAQAPHVSQCDRVTSLSRNGRLELALGSGWHLLRWRDHEFRIEITEREGTSTARILLGPGGAVAFEEFLAHARRHSKTKGDDESGKVVSKVLRNGVWRAVSSFPKRTVASFITGDDTVTRLLADMHRFVNAEDDYIRFGNPFKRTYLIVGPPGSGKSSIISIAASEMDMDVCYITVTADMKESELCAAVMGLTDDSLLVIEDVDVLCTSAASGHSGAQAALAVLTSILDGTLHRHKLISVLTSAQPDALEDVLVRHGRVDHTSVLGHVSEAQVRGIVHRTFPNSEAVAIERLTHMLWEEVKGHNITSSVVAHFLFRRRHMPIEDVTSSEEVRGILAGTHTSHLGDTKLCRASSALYA